MKKILILCVLLLLSSCSIDWNGEKDKKIAELEKQVQELKKEKEDDLFKKKQECFKYKDDMFKTAKKYHNEVYEIGEILFSSSTNSCLFVAKESGGEKILFDYFSNNVIAGQGFTERCYTIADKKIKDKCFEVEEKNDIEYENKIKELKGE